VAGLQPAEKNHTYFQTESGWYRSGVAGMPTLVLHVPNAER
jgi:hypothetical protein